MTGWFILLAMLIGFGSGMLSRHLEWRRRRADRALIEPASMHGRRVEVACHTVSSLDGGSERGTYSHTPKWEGTLVSIAPGAVVLAAASQGTLGYPVPSQSYVFPEVAVPAAQVASVRPLAPA